MRVHPHIRLILLLVGALIPLNMSAKLRSWLGPKIFYGNPPSPRQLHGFAGTSELYVFGGRGSQGQLLNDLFQFDPNTLLWTDLTKSTFGEKPSPRSGHGFASTASGDLYVFGGGGASATLLNDLHRLNLATLRWTQINTPTNLYPRQLCGFTSDDKNLYISSGHGGLNAEGYALLNDLHRFNTVTMVWTDLGASATGQRPANRLGPGLAACAGSLFMFGGFTTGAKAPDVLSYYVDELFRFELAALHWTKLDSEVHGSSPSPRGFLGMASDSKRLFVFGGWNRSNRTQPGLGRGFNDLFQFDTQTMTWTILVSNGEQNAGSPSPRDSLGFLSAGSKLYVFGGLNSKIGLHFNDLYQIDPNNKKMVWMNMSGGIRGAFPSPRANHGFTLLKDKAFVFGGQGQNGCVNDVYYLDTLSLTWTDGSEWDMGQRPAPRLSHGQVSDGNGTHIYVFGGWNGEQNFNDLYRLQISTMMWTNLSIMTNGMPPNPRSCFGLAWQGNSLYVFGGVTSPKAYLLSGRNFQVQESSDFGHDWNDLYSFDTSTLIWTNLSSYLIKTGNFPSPRNSFGFTSTNTGMLYVFGGFSSTTLQFLDGFFMFDTNQMVWTDLSDRVHGQQPSARAGCGLTVVDGKLFLFGGQSALSEFHNDLYKYDVSSLLWTHLASNKNSPDPRAFFGFSSNEKAIHLFGGTGSPSGSSFVYLNDYMYLTLPALVSWPENSNLLGFISIFDWDVLLLDHGKVYVLPIQLNLCVGILPCSLSVISNGYGVLEVIDDGSIICTAGSECYSVSLYSVHIRCNGNIGFVSCFKIQGAKLSVIYTSFSGCKSKTDGGVIQSFDRSEINIISSIFQDSNSAGFGGALCAVGCALNIVNAKFLNCSSARGGGAIWAAAFHPMYGSNANTISSSIHIESSEFENCKATRAGGAIYASTDLQITDITKTGGLVSIYIKSSYFENCTSERLGGALYFAGQNVYADMRSCTFSKCTADNRGGAIAAEDMAKAVLINTSFLTCRATACGGALSAVAYSKIELSRTLFKDNLANGVGGGALYIESSEIQAVNCLSRGNQAPSGAGGVVLFAGDIWSAYKIESPSQIDCSDDNNAIYGRCFASKFHHLHIPDFPSQSSRTYPGAYIQFDVLKQDIFNQTILTDSLSILQVLPSNADMLVTGTVLTKLQNGRAHFSISVNPKFSRPDYEAGIALTTASTNLFVVGVDSEEATGTELGRMRTQPQAVIVSNGSSVCSSGSILVLDPDGFGKCTWCGPGSYSVSPLAGIEPGSPMCFSCPAGGTCPGGSNVTFALGSWILASGIYKLVGCPEGHQLINAFNGIFHQEAQTCRKCIYPQYILNSNDSKFLCQVWQSATYVVIQITLSSSSKQYNAQVKLELIIIIAKMADIPIPNVMISRISSRGSTGRSANDSTEIEVKVATKTVEAAKQVRSKFSLSSLNDQLHDAGFPRASVISADVVSSIVSAEVPRLPTGVVIGTSLGGFAMFLLLIGFSCYAKSVHARHSAHKAFLIHFRTAKMGDEGNLHHLPPALQSDYLAVKIAGKGAFGLVVQVKKRNSSTQHAVKIILPETGSFTEKELRQLKREAIVLDLLTTRKCEHAVSLIGIGAAVSVESDLAWFIMEFLDGEDLHECIQRQSFLHDGDCIPMTRNALAALKILHSEGLVHRDIKPANIMRCRILDAVTLSAIDTFKLIDFGTALGVDEKVAKECMMTLSSTRQMGAGTPPYMSPEMFKDPENASYSSDLWSLGVTMFECVSGKLPFEAESDLLWSFSIAGNMDEKAPNILDKLDDAQRSTFDNNLAKVIAKTLEKRVTNRYQTTDEMHDAVYLCLIDKGEAFYSVFISYRVASDAPLARFIFDELNHSVTPGGHRITVYWDAHRLVKGEDWEEGFATGLLNSMCIFPLLSYGSTAPFAALPHERQRFEVLIKQGWEEKPIGRLRLEGCDSDSEDNLLKEFLIAATLLKRHSEGYRTAEEKGILKAAYPILIGRQEPCGHPEYPKMGRFFEVQGGGGEYADKPSAPTNRAVGEFLKEKANMPLDVCQRAEQTSIKSIMETLTKLQGCQLYEHPEDLLEVEMSKEQHVLVGKGYAGPPCDLNGVTLTEEQKRLCSYGLDKRQLQMLKAEVRNKRADMFEVIDRAFATSVNLPGCSNLKADINSSPGMVNFSSIAQSLRPHSAHTVTAHLAVAYDGNASSTKLLQT